MRRNSLSRFLRRLLRDQRGGVTLTFLLSTTVLLGGSFGAIDLVRYNVAQGRLQNALDAAAISAGRNLAGRTSSAGISDPEGWRDDAYAFFRSNMPDGFLGSSISTDDLLIEYEAEMSGEYTIGHLVDMSVKGDLPLISTGFMKITSFDLIASNQALRRTRSDLEVVLVVDGSGSMNDVDSGSTKSRMAHLKDASNLLVDMVMGAAEANDNSRTFIGIVPFTHVVNVGNNAVTRDWLTPGPSGWRDSPYVADVWNGCITEPRPVNNRPIANVAPANNGPGHFRPLYRARTADLQITSNYPHSNANTLAATFTPDDLGYRMPSNMNLPTNVDTGNYVVPVRRTSGFFFTSYYLRLSFLTNPGTCDTRRQVSFLNRSAASIKADIASLYAEGGTAVPAGLLWGWRMLHPAWSGQWGGPTVDLGDDGSVSMPRPPHRDLTKVMILLTDGANRVLGNLNTDEGFTYSVSYRDTGGTTRTLNNRTMSGSISHGIIDHNSLNDTTSDLTPAGGYDTAALDTFTRQLCTNIKNPDDPHIPGGIKMYTIALGPASDAGLMRQCASANGFYDSTNVNDLSAAFESIAGDLMELRLTR